MSFDLLAESNFLYALFEYNFLRMALITGLIIGFINPIIGSFVVIRRLSFIADTLSHFSLAGLSIGLFLINTIGYTFIGNALYLAIIASVVGAFFIEILRGYYQNYKEISMPIVMSLGTALSGLFISLAGGFNSEIYNYLFGAILLVKTELLYAVITTAVVTLVLVVLYYKKIILMSFDESFAKLVGVNVKAFQFVSTLILALVISLSIATVGVLLVSSLMIIPVAAAMKVGKSFKNTVTIAIIFSELSVFFGLFLSYVLDIAPGATIVLINVFILFLVGLLKRFYMNKRIKQQKSRIQDH